MILIVAAREDLAVMNMELDEKFLQHVTFSSFADNWAELGQLAKHLIGH